MEEIIIAGTQKSQLNDEQIAEARCYLVKMKGIFCGAGSDNGQGCHRTVEELETLWRAKFIEKNKIVPERKHPFLVINEKTGYGLHRYILRDGKKIFDYCGNVNFFCKSCNMIFDKRTGDIKSDETATFQSRKSHEVRPKFKNQLKDHLAKHVEICYKGCINKWSGMQDFSCSQETLEHAFAQEFDVTFDLIQKEDYDIRCTYPRCSGEHIIIKGFPPTVKQTSDYQALINEENPSPILDN